MKKQIVRVLILVAIALAVAIVSTPAGSATPTVHILEAFKQVGSEKQERAI